jgi:hypothetical protein
LFSEIALTGQASAQAPQPMQVSLSIWYAIIETPFSTAIKYVKKRYSAAVEYRLYVYSITFFKKVKCIMQIFLKITKICSFFCYFHVFEGKNGENNYLYFMNLYIRQQTSFGQKT